MNWVILDHAAFVLETGLLLILAGHFFTVRRMGKRYTITYILLLLVLHKITAAVFIGKVGLTAICSVLVDYFLFGVLWSGQWYKRMFVICLYYALMITVDLLLIFMFPLTGAAPDAEHYQFLCMIISRSLLLFLVLIITRKNRQKNMLGNHFILIAPLPALISMAMLISHCGYEVDEVVLNQNLNLSVLVIFVTLMILLCVYTRLARNEEILQGRLKLQKELRREQEDYCAAVLNSYASIRRTRHDLHHYIDAISAFIHTGQYRQAADISSRARQGLEVSLIFTGNETVDAIIYSKRKMFEQIGAKLSIEGVLPQMLNYDSTDICIVLLNALENAAEAVAGLPAKQRIIKLRFRFEEWLLIIVENEFGSRPRTVGGRFISGKAGAMHGIGLESIAAACQRQNGYLETTIEDGRFILAATMQPQQIKKGEKHD